MYAVALWNPVTLCTQWQGAARLLSQLHAVVQQQAPGDCGCSHAARQQE